MASQPSDLVRDSEFVTPSCDDRQTIHEFVEEGWHPSQREVRRREIWIRDPNALGSGASGQVWREQLQGTPRQQPKMRAVKQILVTIRHRRGTARVNREEYTRELEAIMKFSQKKYQRCFVVARGWFEKSPWLYIDLEYFPLGDLHRYIFDRRWLIPDSEVREITRQLLEGLRYMHDEGFAHRDLKPSNILVKAQPPHNRWWVKIGDFGISKRLAANRDVSTVVGTEGYAAPELERYGLGRETTIDFNYKAADMWSLGVVLFQLLVRTGTFPDTGHSQQIIRRGIGHTLRNAGATKGARRLAKTCLQQRPEERITSRAAMENAWVQGRDDSPDRSTVSQPGPEAQQSAVQQQTPRGFMPQNQLQQQPQHRPQHRPPPSPPVVGSLAAQRSISRRPVALPQSPARSPPITQENSSIRSFSPMANANPTLLDPLSPLPSRTSASSNPAPGLEASTERPGRRPSAGYSQPSSPIWPIQGDTSSVGIRPRSGSWRNPARVSNDSYIQRAPSGVAAAPQQAPLSSPPPAYSTIDSFNPVTATESDLWPTIHSAFNGCSATHKLLDRKRSTLSLTFTTKNAFVSPPSSTEAYGSEGPENMRVRLLQTHVGGPSRLAKPNKNLDNGLDTNGNLPGQTVRSRTQPTAGRRLSKTASQNQATSRRVSTSAKKTYGGIPQTTTSRTVTDVGQSLSQLPRILISSDSRLLFTLARPDRLEIWDADSGKEVTCHTVPDMNPGTALLHPSGEKLLFELVNDGRIIMWDTLKGKAVHSIVPSLPDGLAESYRLSKQVFDLSPNGRRLAVLQIWEQTLAFGEDYRAYMSFVDMDTKESLGRVSIPVEQDRQNQIWAPGLHAVRREDTGETHALGSAPDFHFRVMFTPESQHVLVTMRSSVFLVNPGIQRQAKRILQRQSQCITFIAPVLNHVVFSTITDQPGNDSTNRTGTVTVWDMASPQAVLELIHPFNVLGCAISSDGTLALTASSSMVVFWDLRDRLPIFRASTKSSISTRYTPCEFAGNTTFFVTYHVDGTKVWDVPQGYLQRRGQRRDTRYWLDLGFHCRQVQAPSSFPSGRVMADTIPVSWA